MTQKPKDQTPKTEKKPQYSLTTSIIAAVLIVFMCLFIPTGPMKKYNRARAEVIDLQAELKLALQTKAAQQERLHQQETLMVLLKQRKPNFDLWSFLNAALTEANLKERATLENYKPRSDKKNTNEYLSMVQMTVSGVSLNQLVDLLHKIYASNNLIATYSVEYLRPASGNKGLDCKLILMSPKPIA